MIGRDALCSLKRSPDQIAPDRTAAGRSDDIEDFQWFGRQWRRDEPGIGNLVDNPFDQRKGLVQTNESRIAMHQHAVEVIPQQRHGFFVSTWLTLVLADVPNRSVKTL